MSLQDKITKMQKEFIAQVPQEAIKIMEKATKELKMSGIEKKSLKVGDKIPDFTLPNANNEMVSSDSILSKGPLVINFYRGGWCPYCNLELGAFQEILPEIKKLGAMLVAISPNLPEKSRSSIEKNLLSFEVLSDLGNKVARKFGLAYTLFEQLKPLYHQFGIDMPGFNGDDTYELPIPATFVVNSDGIITLAFVDSDYTKRLEPEEVIKILKDLKEKR